MEVVYRQLSVYCWLPPPQNSPHTLFLRYKLDTSDEVKYLSINNHTLTQQQDLAPNVSLLMKQLNDTLVIGYSRGLLCLFAFDKGGRFSGGAGMLVLWNPSLRRSVGILESGYFSVFGFAVCPVTNEPTIVKVSLFPWKVHIFTLSSKKWTEIQCRKPRESITLHQGSQVVIDSYIYRLAYKTISLPHGYFTQQYMIVSFNLNVKDFKAIDLPDTIKYPFTRPRFILSKLKGSLVVIVPNKQVKVWKMEPDCSFTQLFSIKTPSYISNIVGFRKNCKLLVETRERRGWNSALEVYNPCSHHINNLGFSGHDGSFFIRSFKETMHLLDHPDSCVYPEIN